jgi:hypothetical protein
MAGLNDRQRIQLQRILMQQSRERAQRYKTSVAYLRKHPRNATANNVFAGDIVGNNKPKSVWYSQHALLRGDPGSLTRNEINAVIQGGVYEQNRNKYFDSKYGVYKTNRGKIAPLENGKKCPTRRITNGQRTVVLSFCYPRELISRQWNPEVVTAYRR